MRLRSLLRAIRVRRQGGPLGDMAILKCDAFRMRGTKAVEAKLGAVRGYAPPIDMDALRALPDGTLGRDYVRLLEDNGYTPLTVSKDIEPELLARNTLPYRLVITHDMLHVLTGFDTSWAGELGVLAFTAAQGYTRAQRYVSLPMAILFYPLIAPRQIRAMFRCLVQGWRMGKRAAFVLGQRLEDVFARPITELRAELAIEVPSERTGAGYLPQPGSA